MLYSRARARADAEPIQQRPVHTLAAQSSWTGTEITAVVLLGSSPVLVLLTPVGMALTLLTGLAFVWASSQWTQREKWIGTALAVAPLAAAVLFVLTLWSL